MILMHSFFVGRLSYLTAGLLLGWLAVANSACAGVWPSYGADAGRSFATSEQLALPLAPAWRYQTPAPPQPAWPEPGKELHRIDFDYCFEPVAAGGLLLFGSSTDDCVRALDLDTGELRWRFATGGPVRFAPAIAAGRCYIASDDGTLYCVDLRTGRLNWKFLGGPDGRLMIGNGRMISRWPLRSGVLVHEGIVYCTAGIWPSEGVFAHALRAADGEVVWTNDTCGLQYVDTAHAPASALGGVAPQGYLVAADGVLLVPTGRSTPAGFDLQSGKLLYCNPEVHRFWWQGGTRTTAAAGFFFNPCTQGTFSFSHAIREAAEPVIFDGTHVYDVRTGTHAKQRFLPITFYHSNQFYRTLAHGEDLFTLEHGFVRRVDMREPLSTSRKREIWKSAFDGQRGYAMAWAGKHLFIGSESGIHAYDAETGEQAWQASVNGTVRGIAAADGRLILSTDDGAIYCLSGDQASPVQSHIEQAVRSQAKLRLADEWVIQSLQSAAVDRGFAVVVDDSANLARQLVEQTNLQVLLAVDASATRDAIRRQLLEEGAGHGQRLSIIERDQLGDLPPYFANSVIAARGDVPPASLHRLLHPYTGQWLMPGDNAKPIPANQLAERGAELNWKQPGEHGLQAEAGPIPETHRVIQGPFEMLWFGGPGPLRMADRHIVNGPRPRAANGRTFVIGTHDVMAFDAFNGAELWSLPLRDACTIVKYGPARRMCCLRVSRSQWTTRRFGWDWATMSTSTSIPQPARHVVSTGLEPRASEWALPKREVFPFRRPTNRISPAPCRRASGARSH